MEIKLPVFDKSGVQISEVVLVYEYSKYVCGLDLQYVEDGSGKRMMMTMGMSGNGISRKKQFIGVETSSTCISIEVEGRTVFVPKYLSFLQEKVEELWDEP